MAYNASLPIRSSTRSPKRTLFTPDVLPQFLASGWLLTLDAQRVLVGWGEWTHASQPALGSAACYLYLPDFYRESAQPWRFTTAWDVLDRDVFASHVLAGVDGNVNGNIDALHLGLQWLEPSIEEFQTTSWLEIQKGFSERGLRKAVPVVFARTRGRVSIESVLKRLVTQPPQLFPYGFWGEQEGMIGATPEILFAVGQNPDNLQTMALAGTRGKGDRAAELLLSDAKERHEHQLVVDDIKEQLARVGDVRCGETGVLELPSLFHLHTPIEAKLHKRLSLLDLVECLHPTPALGVSPRSLGFLEMKLWDLPQRRGRFGAPFAAVWPEGMHALVAIRNVEWSGEEIRIGSGCGIVPESRLEREWKELALKRESVKRMLGL